MKFCAKSGMTFGSSGPSKCFCECTEDNKKTCSSMGPSVAAVATSVKDKGMDIFSCGCQCSNVNERCSPNQVRTDHEGVLPNVVGTPSFLNVEDINVCSCVCSRESYTALVRSGAAVEGKTIMVSSDTTCKTAKCIVENEKVDDPANKFFNKDPSSCRVECKVGGCPTGKQRVEPSCKCNCPVTAPHCNTDRQELSSDCSRCICKERCPAGMSQDPESCRYAEIVFFFFLHLPPALCKTHSLSSSFFLLSSFSFRCSCSGQCPAGKSITLTNRGCQCVCDISNKCDRKANMVLDPSSCQCICDPRLPKSTSGGKSLWLSSTAGGGCFYGCGE